MMKRTLIILIVLALLFSTFTLTPKSTAYGAGEEPDLKYHLDIGVYVVSYVNGKWTNGISYGSTQPYTANLTFNDEIKVKRILTMEQAENEGIDIWSEEYFTNNIPNSDGKYDNDNDAFRNIYTEAISPSISGIQIKTGAGSNIKYSYNALLQSKRQEGYDLIVKYDQKREKIPTVESVVIKNNSLIETIKALEAEKAELWLIVKNISGRGATAAQIEAFNRYQTIDKQLIALYEKPTETTKEQVIISYERDVRGFIDEVFRFWGNEQALFDENRSLYNLLKNMSELKDVNMDDKYYLVFLPTVVEYEIDEPSLPPIPIPETTGGCSSEIDWYERHDHKVPGPNSTTRTCYHICHYVATLSSSATLTADKPNGGPLAFKSGYGFKVTMNNSVSVKMVSSDKGTRCGERNKYFNNSEIPSPPTAAEVRTDWKVVNKEKRVTQGTVIALAKASGSSSTVNFTTAPNPVSNYNNPLIYTDVALPGTRQNPVKHTITVYASGGGVNGVAFCNSVPLTFMINGNMYEDDSTSDRTR